MGWRNELAISQIGVLVKGMTALEESMKNVDNRMNAHQRNADDMTLKMERMIAAVTSLSRGSRGPGSVPPPDGFG